MVRLNYDTDAEVIIGSSSKAVSGDDRKVHVFESCRLLRTKTRWKPLNTRHDGVGLCSDCERRLLDGEKPDAHPDVFEKIEV